MVLAQGQGRARASLVVPDLCRLNLYHVDGARDSEQQAGPGGRRGPASPILQQMSASTRLHVHMCMRVLCAAPNLPYSPVTGEGVHPAGQRTHQQGLQQLAWTFCLMSEGLVAAAPGHGLYRCAVFSAPRNTSALLPTLRCPHPFHYISSAASASTAERLILVLIVDCPVTADMLVVSLRSCLRPSRVCLLVPSLTEGCHGLNSAGCLRLHTGDRCQR